ncbi:ubiquitin-like domain-containing CTD phosphatase 1 [Heterostelium album PN500]|uniref:Ubiquitin-like domain-containing CTD phosphatase 1 n=1 Tax=Heterostelium pallidum (strain ATCC 26659 / Pp 5 / PN500) TaxID=670386 RepID=D3B033_HETP5|nr:ubiquitin-like domain-containing CTD phosphatase 1 [Heterostelium album PN500]EFA84657.1 ubiquitin-like domain-containing CTD phosphatase 1 [Heterostelium album PN500]|eukprot:XP_020436770.1 ubiquitin-like domain-containing CTD phosphatase 1 [Heterostelium album PN500]
MISQDNNQDSSCLTTTTTTTTSSSSTTTITGGVEDSPTMSTTTTLIKEGASTIIIDSSPLKKEIECTKSVVVVVAAAATTTTTEELLQQEKPKEAELVNICAKWSGKEYRVSVERSETIADLKRKLESLTNVLIKRQKILGLSKGMLPPDETVIGTLNIPANHNIIMMGTPEANIIVQLPVENENVFNDLEFDYIPDSDEISHLEKNQNKLVKYRAKAEISVINQPRTNKKLLVLDLDHTILDFKDQDVASN